MRKFWLRNPFETENPGLCSGDPGAGDGGGGGGQSPFYSGIADEGLRGWVEQAGYKDLDGMAKSLRDTVAMRGKPAEAYVELPDWKNPEASAAFWDRIGRPKDWNGYELGLPDGGDKEFHEFMLGALHKRGAPKDMARGLFEDWQQYSLDRIKRENEAITRRQEAEIAALKGDGEGNWGGNYATHEEQARRAFRQFGGDDETMGMLERSLGTAKFLKLFQRVGEALGESNYHDDKGGKGGGPGFKLSPQAAEARKTQLLNDAGFREKYMANDAAAIREINELNQILASV